MLEDAFDTAQSSDYIDSIVVQLPELSVMSLGRPPERIARDGLNFFVIEHEFFG